MTPDPRVMDVDTAFEILTRGAGDELQRFMGQPRPPGDRVSRTAIRKAALAVAGDGPVAGLDLSREEDVERLADQSLGHFMILWWLEMSPRMPAPKTLRRLRKRRRLIRFIERMSAEPQGQWSRYTGD
jgi:hypothetical protein